MLSGYTLSAAGAAAALVVSGLAVAQPSPEPNPQPNSQRAASPAGSAQQTAAQIELPQSTTATYATWVVQCQTRTGPPVEKTCDMAQVTQAQGSNQPFSRVAVAQPQKGQAVKLVVQLPVNASFATPVRIQAGDTDPAIAAPFARCIPGGCFAEFDLKDDVLKKFRASTGNGKMTFADAGGHEIAVPISFNGFAQAFDALMRE